MVGFVVSFGPVRISASTLGATRRGNHLRVVPKDRRVRSPLPEGWQGMDLQKSVMALISASQPRPELSAV